MRSVATGIFPSCKAKNRGGDCQTLSLLGLLGPLHPVPPRASDSLNCWALAHCDGAAGGLVFVWVWGISACTHVPKHPGALLQCLKLLMPHKRGLLLLKWCTPL